MAQGDIITTDVKGIITTVWSEHLKNGWTAKEIQVEVAKRVQEKWPGKYKPGWPGLRATQNKIAEIKDEYKDYQKLTIPWHLGALEDCPLPAEAVSHILKVQKWAASQNLKPVTIWEAKWINNLYSAIKDNKRRWKLPLERAIWKAAMVYASCEMVSKLSGEPEFNTIQLDNALIQGEREFTLLLHNTLALSNAIAASQYQKKGLGTAKHYLEYLEKDDEK